MINNWILLGLALTSDEIAAGKIVMYIAGFVIFIVVFFLAAQRDLGR